MLRSLTSEREERSEQLSGSRLFAAKGLVSSGNLRKTNAVVSGGALACVLEAYSSRGEVVTASHQQQQSRAGA
jgi:hypothetical protein